ncbi:hypothetical protein [Streptomyces sp. NPDC001480]|uniref:hypothetical protein n=1 Tax=Streptomyces sp. NPDC001480 TaxID=3364577 RepID=UPI0036ACADE5
MREEMVGLVPAGRLGTPDDVVGGVLFHVLAVDVKGTMLCVHEFGSRMLEQGHGAIVRRC